MNQRIGRLKEKCKRVSAHYRIDMEVDEELSLGDYVLSGGELPALVVMDAVTRLLPGALGDADSAQEDSFMDGLLDYPHYTRPEEVDGLRVPDELLGGNHEFIRRWRTRQALGRTWQRRPELLDSLQLDEEQQALLGEAAFVEADAEGAAQITQLIEGAKMIATLVGRDAGRQAGEQPVLVLGAERRGERREALAQVLFGGGRVEAITVGL